MPELRCGMGVTEKNSCRDIFFVPSFFFFPMMSGIVFLHAARTTQNLLPLLLLSVSRMDGCFYDESAFVCARVRNDDESGKRFSLDIFHWKKWRHFFNPTYTQHALSLSLFLSLSQSRKIYARGDGTTREHSLRENPLLID